MRKKILLLWTSDRVNFFFIINNILRGNNLEKVKEIKYIINALGINFTRLFNPQKKQQRLYRYTDVFDVKINELYVSLAFMSTSSS